MAAQKAIHVARILKNVGQAKAGEFVDMGGHAVKGRQSHVELAADHELNQRGQVAEHTVGNHGDLQPPLAALADRINKTQHGGLSRMVGRSVVGEQKIFDMEHE